MGLMLTCAAFTQSEAPVQLKFSATDAESALDLLFRGSNDGFTISSEAAMLPVPATDISGVSREAALKMIGKTAGFVSAKVNGVYVISKLAKAIQQSGASMQTVILAKATPRETVHVGMSRAEVRTALGSPLSIHHSATLGNQQWGYSNEIVEFTSAGVAAVIPIGPINTIHAAIASAPPGQGHQLPQPSPQSPQMAAGYAVRAPFFSGLLTPDQAWERNWAAGMSATYPNAPGMGQIRSPNQVWEDNWAAGMAIGQR
jgi:hypothetical protein